MKWMKTNEIIVGKSCHSFINIIDNDDEIDNVLIEKNMIINQSKISDWNKTKIWIKTHGDG